MGSHRISHLIVLILFLPVLAGSLAKGRQLLGESRKLVESCAIASEETELAATEQRSLVILDSALRQLGALFLNTGRNALARAAYEQLLHSHSQLSDPQFDRAAAHLQLGRMARESSEYSSALAHFESGLQENPDLPGLHLGLGSTHLLQQGMAATSTIIAELETELTLDKESYPANLFLGVLYTETRRPQEALLALHRAVELQPDNPDPFLYLGRAFFQLSSYGEAVEALQRFAERSQDPTRNDYQVVSGYYLLGQALMRTGKRREGLYYIRQSEEFRKMRSASEQRQMQASMQGRPTKGNLKTMATVDYAELIRNSESPPVKSTGNVTLTQFVPPQESEKNLRAAALRGFQCLAHAANQRKQFKRAVKFLENGLFWDGWRAAETDPGR